MRREFGLFLLLVITGLHLQAQVNLVPNNSFEVHDTCPFSQAQISFALPWVTTTLGTPDYYNSCNTGTENVPNNGYGSQNAKSGNAYAGIGGYMSQSMCVPPCPPTFREYVTVQLSDTLKKNKNYCVEFYVSLSDKSDFAIDRMGAYFSTTKQERNDYSNIAVVPQISNPKDSVLLDKNSWRKISGNFIASGEEKFITIGNFYDDSNTNILNVTGGSYAFAYYYIDDISVIFCDTIAPPPVDSVVPPITFADLFIGGDNTGFQIKNLPAESMLIVYDLLGRIIFYSANYQNNWGTNVASGIYLYRLTLVSGEVRKGKLVVVK